MKWVKGRGRVEWLDEEVGSNPWSSMRPGNLAPQFDNWDETNDEEVGSWSPPSFCGELCKHHKNKQSCLSNCRQRDEMNDEEVGRAWDFGRTRVEDVTRTLFSRRGGDMDEDFPLRRNLKKNKKKGKKEFYCSTSNFHVFFHYFSKHSARRQRRQNLKIRESPEQKNTCAKALFEKLCPQELLSD